MENTTHPALQLLLQTWNHHQDLRAGGAATAELWASRAQLDSARLDARKAVAGSVSLAA